jgi:phosphoadenosine phosphosulfate reductase
VRGVTATITDVTALDPSTVSDVAGAVDDATTADALAVLNTELEARTARERLAWAVERYGDALLFTSSFGPGSGVLLHLWSEVARHLPVYFIDTGFLFDATLRYRDEVASALGLALEVLRPRTAKTDFLAKHGLTIYQDNPDFCCAENKVEPLQRALPGKRAWVSGLRRDQGPSRAGTPVVLPTAGGPTKVHPLVDWTARDVYQYLAAHGVPEHPMFEQGYVSIGCAPCTRPVLPGEDERAGRWSGSAKTECGIHTFLKPKW